ncbi:MAG: DUF2339 domain-containing protein, partial [Actinomycetota bacterium]
MENEQTRIEALEARVAELEATVASLVTQAPPDLRRLSSLAPPTPPPTAPPVAPPPLVGAQPVSQPPPPTGLPVGVPAPPPAPPAPNRNVELDSEVALKWGGVGLVVLAVGFAVNTAIQRGWIGPELQLLGALAISLGLIGTGLRLKPTRPSWTHTLCSGGVAALFATFGSDLFVDLANTDLAYGLTFIVLLGSLVLAREAESEWVAVVGVPGALTGWFVIGELDVPFVPSVVAFVVGFGVVLILAIERSWFGLRFLTLFVGLGLTLVMALAGDGDAQTTVTLVAGGVVFVALLAIPSMGDTEDSGTFV